MKESAFQTLVTTLYFPALINPVSKVSVPAVFSPETERRHMRRLITRAGLVAAGILVGSMIFGNFVLRSVFRVEIYSLRLAGGLVLC